MINVKEERVLAVLMKREIHIDTGDYEEEQNGRKWRRKRK